MFEMKRPCAECPFLKSGGVRLTAGRVREVAGNFLTEPGAMFPCHKTVDSDDTQWARHAGWQMCAGGLLFAEKVRPTRPVTMIQLAERMGLYDRTQLHGAELVFDSLAEMAKTAIR